MTVDEILRENGRRREALLRPYDPLVGDPGDGPRAPFHLPGLTPHPLWLPEPMLADPLCVALLRAGSLDDYIEKTRGNTPSEWLRTKVREEFRRLRLRHDFPFWAATCAYIGIFS